MSGTTELTPESAEGPLPSLNSTIGAILIGGLVTAVLYGVTALQTVIYYQHSQRDKPFFKAVVFVLWQGALRGVLRAVCSFLDTFRSLDTFDMCLIGHILYHYMVSNYGNFSSLENITWSVVIHVLTTAVTEVVVRSMFTVRIWKLSQGKLLPVAIVSSANALDLIFGIIITAKAFGKTFAQLAEIEKFVLTEFAAGLSGDALAVLFLCYYLHHYRTGMSGTESLINVLMVYVVNTGLLTVVALTINIALFAAQRTNFAYIAVYFIISKLYVNAYLAMLNARDHIREQRDEIVATIHLSRLSGGGGSSQAHASHSTGASGVRPLRGASAPQATAEPFRAKVVARPRLGVGI